MTDSDLVRRALDGDAQAFTTLALRHTPACLRFASRMLGTREDAEDVTQETLVRAYRALAVYDGRTAFRTWLFTILVNRCRSALAMRMRRSRWFLGDSNAVERASIPSHGADTELRVELTRALDTWPSEQREAFLLKHVEGLEYTEMSAVTGANVSALKMRVQRACAALKQELREYDHVG
jgi:RNA polymerase sigma-70 factor (ECF subfamily)